MAWIDYKSTRPRGQRTLTKEPNIPACCHVEQSEMGIWTELVGDNELIESTFGDYSYADHHTSIIYSDVGKFASIAAFVRINPGNHPMERVTQHHCMYRKTLFGLGDENDEDFFNWRRDHRCQIGHDVWLGHGVVVMPGVSIGHGAVVGSGSVVTKDIDPYEIAVGSPAKPIRKRFSEKIVEKLLEIQWWEWSDELFRERFEDFNDMGAFIEKYG